MMEIKECIERITEMIDHPAHNNLSVGDSNVLQYAKSILERVSEIRLATIIHQTKQWQALHLEVQADILEDVKKGLATAITSALRGERK